MNPESKRFDEMDLPGDFLQVLEGLGFSHPTPIQEKTLPHGMQGKDVIGKAETGTGKTLAFGLPMIAKIDPHRTSCQGLVLCPTRELAFQVMENLQPFCDKREISLGLAIGGENVSDQLKRIRGAQIVVGTPGRIIELNRDHQFTFGWSEVLVLDEFDRMLDMGFLDDVTLILKMTTEERQTLLFSATFPPAIKKIAQKFMKHPVTIETATGTKTADTIRQTAMKVRRANKFRKLREILDHAPEEDTFIVFCNSKKDVRFLDKELWGRGYNAASLSSDHDQDVRFQVLNAFKNKEFKIIVATDVASRGLDIPHVSQVVNYNVPHDVEDYVHRIGRTGRAGRQGLVTTLVSDDDHYGFTKVVKMVGEEKIDGATSILENPPSREERNRSSGRSRGSGRQGNGKNKKRPSRPKKKPQRKKPNDT